MKTSIKKVARLGGLVAAAVALAGCATMTTEVIPLYSQPGETRFVVKCPVLNQQFCAQRAERECGGNFEVTGHRPRDRDGMVGQVIQCRP